MGKSDNGKPHIDWSYALEVSHCCRTVLQSRAEALAPDPEQDSQCPANAHPILALVQSSGISVVPMMLWPSRSHRLATSICGGSANCQYESKVVGNSRRSRSSGCNVAWRTYSDAVFDAFQQAKPDLHYKNHRACVLEAQARNHRCPRPHCTRIRGEASDHDELARYPDSEKLIISHPYPSEAN